MMQRRWSVDFHQLECGLIEGGGEATADCKMETVDELQATSVDSVAAAAVAAATREKGSRRIYRTRKNCGCARMELESN